MSFLAGINLIFAFMILSGMGVLEKRLLVSEVKLNDPENGVPYKPDNE